MLIALPCLQLSAQRSMGSFFVRIIILLLLAALVLAWALTAFSRAEDPNLISGVIPVNETQLQWGMRVSTSMIYFMLMDAVNSVGIVVNKWHDKLSPPYRLGSLVILALLALNLRYFLIGWKHRSMASVYCEVDNTRAKPIRGSYNRYRCGRGHQFADEPHGL
ncbi:MAG: hypothetical protein ACRD82_02435 [Blastocatellia bacterium]